MIEASAVNIIGLAESMPAMSDHAGHCLRRVHMTILRFRCSNALVDTANHLPPARQRECSYGECRIGSTGLKRASGILAATRARVLARSVYAPEQPIAKRLEGRVLRSSVRGDKIIGILGQERIIKELHETPLR